MSVLYNTGARAVAEGSLLTETVKLALVVGTELPEEAADATLSTMSALLAIVDEASGGGYARAIVADVAVETDSGTIVTHGAVSFGSINVGHVCGLIYYIDDAFDTLVSLHDADFTTSGSPITINGDTWLAINRGLPFRIGTTLKGDGTEGNPLEVKYPQRAPLIVEWNTDDPVITVDVDIAVITSGTVTGNARTLGVSEPIAGDPYSLVVINADDYRLTIEPDTATIDGGTSITVLPGAIVRLWYDGAGAWYSSREPRVEHLTYALSSETVDLTTGTAKLTIRMPFACTLVDLPRASLTHESTSGVVTVDINEGGVSILSTKLTIDANEKTSVSAATPAVLSDLQLADDAEIVFDVDTAGVGAKGLKVTLIVVPS